MPIILGDAYSSAARPALLGRRGAVSAAHPLAAAAGQQMFASGGGAVDAAIAAQAVLCVVAPDACGLGGDLLALVAEPGRGPVAVTGAGAAPMGLTEVSDGANSVTVPGIVSAWEAMARRWGKLPLSASLAPAIAIAREGFPMPASLHAAAVAQKGRLIAGGAEGWVVARAGVGKPVRQPELADLLEAIARDGAAAFYAGEAGAAIVLALQSLGGAMQTADLAAHSTEMSDPIVVPFGGWRVAVQPPPTQGVLLAMSLKALAGLGPAGPDDLDHLCVELTEAAFTHRSRCAEGAALLQEPLPVDRDRAARRGGPRAYLHTAGVAASDSDGLTVSSLVSVFDDFGSCVFVPSLGIVLNDRAAGFTDGANAPRPGARPVHTLAPSMLLTDTGPVALSTPGADGQVQTLLQVISKLALRGESLADAVHAPRWRSEGGELLIEAGHPALADLDRRGHALRPLKSGDTRFGAVAAAGVTPQGPFALSDWRRTCWAGVA
jgi:gamma-glutamyltranspeptidase/glutathione hydrolase